MNQTKPNSNKTLKIKKLNNKSNKYILKDNNNNNNINTK